jgi:hypothetical protein
MLSMVNPQHNTGAQSERVQAEQAGQADWLTPLIPYQYSASHTGSYHPLYITTLERILDQTLLSCQS